MHHQVIKMKMQTVHVLNQIVGSEDQGLAHFALKQRLETCQQILTYLELVSPGSSPVFSKFLSFYSQALVQLSQFEMHMGIVTREQFLVDLKQSVAMKAKAKKMVDFMA